METTTTPEAEMNTETEITPEDAERIEIEKEIAAADETILAPIEWLRS